MKLCFSELINGFSGYVMDISKNLWEPIASMGEVRHNHACGIVNKDTIFAAGGNDAVNDVLDSVEMFSLVLMEWTDSTPLPNPIASEASLQYGFTVLVFGGTKIYQLDETSLEWSVRDETLLSARSGYLAIPVTGT